MNLIIEEIRKKNHKVFQNLFNENYKNFVIYANRYLFDQQASEDIVQDIFIYIWENAKKINVTSSLDAYLYTMIKNRCLNFLKSIKITDDQKVLEFNANFVSEHIFDITSEEEKIIIYHQILKIVDTLPKKMQEIVELKFIQNYKYKEISEELGISVNTVKTQLRRAKSKIYEMIISVLILLEII